MRPIKFRAWDEENKVMIGVRSIHFDTKCRIIACYCNIDHRGDSPIKSFKLLQFTGLHDKNGKEIYEGDIIQFFTYENLGHWAIRPKTAFFDEKRGWINKHLSQVRYNDEQAAFIPFGFHSYAVKGIEAEVIGNIYENPELLKEKSNEKTG